MQVNIKSHKGFQIEYFVNDCLARGSVMIDKEWEPHYLSFVKMLSCENIIDVGANFGYHTMTFSKEVSGNVYSFEPQIQNFGLLERNVSRNNLDNVKVYNQACSDVFEDVKMPYVIDMQGLINMGDFTPNTKNIEVVVEKYSTVKAVTLDSKEFPKIDLIKIDVQGYEVKVLKGARTLIDTYKPIIMIEIEDRMLKKTGSSSEELVKFIQQMGYYIFYLEYNEYPVDHVCVHETMIDTFNEKFKDMIFDHTIDNYLNHNVLIGINKLIRTRPLKQDVSFTSKDEPYRDHHWDYRTRRFISRRAPS